MEHFLIENPITYWCCTYGVVTKDQWALCPNNVCCTIITGKSDGSRKSPELPTLHMAARSARYWQSNVHINLLRFPGTQTRPALPCHCYGESHRSLKAYNSGTQSLRVMVGTWPCPHLQWRTENSTEKQLIAFLIKPHCTFSNKNVTK